MTMETNLINIVLVDTIHPGNIGSVARAMKTMGLSRLSLVNPRVFPSNESTALAGNATDVLDNDSIYKRLWDMQSKVFRVEQSFEHSPTPSKP